MSVMEIDQFDLNTNHSKGSIDAKVKGNIVSMDLLQLENSERYMELPSVTTITFYNGIADEEYLRNRVSKIIEANPWLCGSLVRDESLQKTTLNYPIFLADDVFSVSEISNIGDDIPYSINVKLTEYFAVKKGIICLQNSKELLFRVSLIKISQEKFAIIFSVCHVIADVYTFYKLYSMLDKNIPISSMIASRVHSFSESLIKKDAFDFGLWFNSTGFHLRSRWINFFGQVKPDRRIQIIDINWIESQKEIESTTENLSKYDIKFISTNDIISSFALKRSKCQIGVIAVDGRNRIENITNDHAGNYLFNPIYQKDDFESPILIRKSLSNFRRQVTGDLPGTIETFFVKKIAAVTNWSTFFHEVNLTDCKQIAHFPHISEIDGYPFDVYIIFNVTKNKLACFSFTREVIGNIFPTGTVISV